MDNNKRTNNNFQSRQNIWVFVNYMKLFKVTIEIACFGCHFKE